MLGRSENLPISSLEKNGQGHHSDLLSCDGGNRIIKCVLVGNLRTKFVEVISSPP